MGTSGMLIVLRVGCWGLAVQTSMPAWPGKLQRSLRLMSTLICPSLADAFVGLKVYGADL